MQEPDYSDLLGKIPAVDWQRTPASVQRYLLSLLPTAASTNAPPLWQQRLESSPQASELCYRHLIQTQTDLLLRSAPDTTITFANRALCEALGLPFAQVLGLQWASFVPAEDLPEIHRKIANLSPQNPTFENINRDYRAGKQVGWTQWVSRGIFDQYGQLLEIQSVGRDVTVLLQQFQREQALNRVLKAIHASLDLETIFATATEETANFLAPLNCCVVQYLPERRVWKTVAEFYHNNTPKSNLEIPDQDNPFSQQLKQLQVVQVVSTDQITDAVNQAISQQAPGAWLLIPLAVGGDIWGSLTLNTVEQPFVWQEEQIRLARAVADRLEIAIQQANLYQQAQRELAERRRTEAALRDSETRFRNLAANIPGAIFRYLLRTDGSDAVLYMSPGCLQIWELEPAVVEGDASPLWQMVYPEDRPAMVESVLTSARTLQPWHWEWRIITPSGQLKWLEAAGQPQRLENGDVLWDSMILDISDRKQVEQVLIQSEQRFRSLFESTSKIAVQGYNRQRQVIYWNTASEEMYGYSQAEALGRQLEDLIIPPALRSQVITDIERWLTDGILIPSGELTLLRKDGSSVTVYSSHLLLNNIQGEPELYCVDIDLTDRHQAEADLRRALAVNQALIDAIPDFILRLNRAGVYLDAIPTEFVKPAMPPVELIGRRLTDVLEPALAQQWLTRIEQAFVTGEIQVHEYELHIEGQWYDEEARIVVSGPDEVTVLIRNISDRKQAERALRDSEARYRLLAQNTNDLVCLHAVDGHYLYVSPSCEPLLGYRYEELLGQHPADFCHPEDQEPLRLALDQARTTHKAVMITYRMRQPSGSLRWLEMIAKPLESGAAAAARLQSTSRDVTERVQVQERLQYEAVHDRLTGLPNRTLLLERIGCALQRIQQQDDYHFAVLFLDLDRFKVINDSLGHLVGDQLLVQIAQAIAATLDGRHLAARFGGDEFVLLLEEIVNSQEAVAITEQVLAALAVPVTIGGHTVQTTASVGLVWGDRHYTAADQLLRDADIAMYRAKQQGRATYAQFDPAMYADALRQLHLENDLHRALERQELLLEYQPIANLQTGYLEGFEALIRWQHPTQGRKSPGEFMAIAEETGLVTALDRWVLQRACQQLATWRRDFPQLPQLKIHVNLSAKDLQHAHLIATVDRILATTQVASRYLVLEITESMLIYDVEATIAVLEQLKARGLQLSIDDFGTGYSSLSYLHRLPLDNLKVDRSFVNQMQAGTRNYRIIETIATLSRQLGLQAVAEGIETPAQLVGLRQLGYQFGQGYLMARPLGVQAATALLAQQPTSLLPSP